ncbi:hypothetical protein J6590_017195 [Homalodisca vitripennis]|nr:hypothetical protein J6590_017195 [Homalodisca vitripennis]
MPKNPYTNPGLILKKTERRMVALDSRRCWSRTRPTPEKVRKNGVETSARICEWTPDRRPECGPRTAWSRGPTFVFPSMARRLGSAFTPPLTFQQTLRKPRKFGLYWRIGSNESIGITDWKCNFLFGCKQSGTAITYRRQVVSYTVLPANNV